MVVVDLFVHVAGVDLAGTVAVDGCPDVAEQLSQLRLIVGADAFARRAVRLWCSRSGRYRVRARRETGPGTSRHCRRHATSPLLRPIRGARRIRWSAAAGHADHTFSRVVTADHFCPQGTLERMQESVLSLAPAACGALRI